MEVDKKIIKKEQIDALYETTEKAQVEIFDALEIITSQNSREIDNETATALDRLKETIISINKQTRLLSGTSE